jgi:hypothetical protein
MKYLIPDTNIFVQDFRMTGNTFSVFISNYKAVADKVIVPKVVYQETINRYSMSVHNEIESTNKHIRKLIGYVGEKLKYPNIKASDEYKKIYEAYFLEKLGSIDFDIYQYPDVSHEKIAQKAIEKIKPFKSNGVGYCDTLIWETILEILNKEADCEVLFITNNKQDFLDDNELSKELKSDLVDNNILPQRVKAYRSLNDVVDELLLPHLETMETLIEQINGNAIPCIDVHEWISENMFKVVDDADAGFVTAGVNRDECTTELSEIYEVTIVNASDAKVLNDTDIYILINTEFGLSVNVCADYGQYEDSEKVTEIFDNEGMGAPTPYECVCVSGSVTAELSVIIKNKDFSNASIELQSLSGYEGFIDYDVKRMRY